MLHFLLENNFYVSVNTERISMLISALTFGCEHTLLLDLVTSIRKAGENTTKNPTLESILNLPPAPEDSSNLATEVNTLRFCLLYCKWQCLIDMNVLE